MRLFPLLRGWLKDVPPEHLEHDDPLEELPEEQADVLVESIAKTIAEKGMAFPAKILLDVGRPISFMMSQGLIFTGPFLSPFMSEKLLNTASAFLTRRKNITKLVERLEELYSEEVAGSKT